MLEFFYLIITLKHKIIYLIYFECFLVYIFLTDRMKLSETSTAFNKLSSLSLIKSYIIQFSKISIQYFEGIVRENSTKHFVKDFLLEFEKTL